MLNIIYPKSKKCLHRKSNWTNFYRMTNVKLGAHLSGLSARWLDSSFGKVNTIVGLDPAGPGFSFNDVENRLNRSDANYVLVLHTDTRMYGMREAIGHGMYN